MTRVFLGIVIGILLFFLFLYFGGADYMKDFGRKTEKVGKELKQYEKDIQEGAKKAKDIAEKTGEKLKKHMP